MVEVLARLRRRVAVLAAALLLLLAACTDSGPGTPAAPTGPQPGGTLRIALPGASVALDPALAAPTDVGAAMVAELLHGRLTTTSPDGREVGPSLAESFDMAPDATKITFHLRPGARFSDGSPLTAADVVASLQRVAALGPASLASARLDGVAGYQAFAVDRTAPALTGLGAPDPATVVVVLARPDADLPALLAGPAYAVRPAASVASGAPALAAPAAGAPSPPTSGPYRLVEGDADHAVLERADGVDPATAPPDRVELRRTADADTAARLWADGQVDLAPLPSARAAQLPAGVGVVAQSPLSAIWWLGLNTAVDGTSDVRLRRAVALGLDRPALLALLPGRSALDGLAPREVPGGDVSCGTSCTRDVAAAKAIVAEIAPEGGASLRLDVYDDPSLLALADAVKAQLAEVGIAVEVRSRPFADYRDGALIPDRQLFWFGWVGAAPTAGAYLSPVFRSDAPDNVVGLKDPEVDAAIAAASSTVDPAARADAWARAHTLVLDRVVAVPLAEARAAVAVAQQVQGFQLRLDGTPVLPDLWLSE